MCMCKRFKGKFHLRQTSITVGHNLLEGVLRDIPLNINIP